MGIGSTAKKIQAVAERAEQLYEQIIELRQRIIKLEESVDETTDQVDQLETATEKQTVLLRALAEQQGLDVEHILANAAIEEAEGEDSAEVATEAQSGGGATSGERTDGGAREGSASDDGASDDSATVVDSSGNPVE